MGVSELSLNDKPVFELTVMSNDDTVQTSTDARNNRSVQTGVLLQRIDEAMRVQRGSCEELAANSGDDDDDEMMRVVRAVIIAFAVVLCVVCAVGLWCFMKSKRGQASIGGAEPQTATATAEEEAEPEIEVSMERQAITHTAD